MEKTKKEKQNGMDVRMLNSEYLKTQQRWIIISIHLILIQTIGLHSKFFYVWLGFMRLGIIEIFLLSRYIYKRLKFLNNKTYSQFGTLLFLAVWHGFHSGYYATFFYEFITILAEKNVSLTASLSKTLKLRKK